MATILEAKAIISAADATGSTFERIAQKLRGLRQAASTLGVAGSVAAINDKLAAAGKKAVAVGKASTVGVTLPAALAARSVYQNVREFELASNKLKAFGDLSEGELKKARTLARDVGSDYAVGPTGVINGMVEQIKAGFEGRHLEAIQRPLLDFATLAEIDVPQASELAIFSLAGFGKMYDRTGRMLESGMLQKNLREMVDLFAILNKVAPGNIKQISETFKYSAATAKNLAVSPEQLGAFTATLAQAGIIGPEAGVALRSMLVRFIKTPRPALAAAAAAGLKMDDYVIKNPALLKPDSLLSAIENQTGTLKPKQRAALLGRLGKLDGLTGEDYEKGLIAAIQSTGSGDLKDADIAGKLASRIMGTAIEKIDIMRFLKDVFTKVPNPAAFMSLFMDQRQGNRLANLDAARVGYMLTQMEKELTEARTNGTSVSTKMANEINSGVIESENKLRGSYQNLIQSVADSGVLDAAVKAMNGMAGALRSIGETNPKLLETSTYAVAAAAALGPVVWILGKLASAAAIVGKAAAWALPIASAPPVAAAAAAIGSVGVLHEETKRYAGTTLAERLAAQRGGRSMNDARRAAFDEERARHGLMPVGGLQPLTTDAVRGALGGSTLPRASIEDVRAAIEGRPAKAELTGQADIKVTVENKPSPEFLSEIRTMISNTINNIRIGGTPPVGSAGSTGSAMPEVGPAP